MSKREWTQNDGQAKHGQWQRHHNGCEIISVQGAGATDPDATDCRAVTLYHSHFTMTAWPSGGDDATDALCDRLARAMAAAVVAYDAPAPEPESSPEPELPGLDAAILAVGADLG